MEDDPANDFDSVQWRRDDDEPETAPAKLKSNGKRRQNNAAQSQGQSQSQSQPPDRNADSVDTAGPGIHGYLDCTVDTPQKENEGTKDAFVSYRITTRSDFKTFAKSEFTVRRRFTDFVFLYKSLFRNYPHIAVPPLPDKHKMEYVRGDRFGPDFTQRRAHSLQRFVKRISLHPVLRRNQMFLMFLETTDWNSVMRGRGPRGSFSDASTSGSLGGQSPNAGPTSAFESFQDWSMNLFSKPHKADKRFIEVREKADKLDEDLGHVEKIVARVARREGDLETDYADLATQMRKLVTMEQGVAEPLTSFASSVETTSQGIRTLREATDQDYLGSLRDMASYVASLKALLKTREQKQLDFEALTDYLNKSANDRDMLASQHGSATLSSGATSFIRSKIEDVRGVDHEQSRRDRLRKTEMQIERLTREVEEAKKLSEAFDDQVVGEVSEFERIKSCEFKDTLGGLADAEIEFYKGVLSTWEEFLKGMEKQEQQQKYGSAGFGLADFPTITLDASARVIVHFSRQTHSSISRKDIPRWDLLLALEHSLGPLHASFTESPLYNINNMLEARLEQAQLLKKVVDAIRDLVQDCNFDCNDSGIALQAMDNSHVALVSMLLSASAFSPFRCDRNIALGINLSSLTKVLRAAQNDDILTLKAEDAPDVVSLTFESNEADRVSEYDIKLMDIDQEHLGIPETQYAATISMPSAEFQRICRDLSALSESVAIECTKEGIKFACNGDIGSGSVSLRQHTNVEKPENNVEIALSEPVALTFSLKYLVNFCKASGLSTSVKLCLSNEVPLLVEYSLASASHLRFYLAPKIGDEE